MTPLCDLCRHSQNEFLRLPPVYQAEGTILLARVQALSFGLNALPAHCLPSWSVNVTQAVVRRAAMDIRRSEDHGNCAASAMLLALLRPQMFASMSNVPVEWPPLRIFGVPPPRTLLHRDFHPRSGHGPDNFRGNVMEGLSMHLASGSAAAAEVHSLLQETWILMRTRVALVTAILQLQAPIEGWNIVNATLSVRDDLITG